MWKFEVLADSGGSYRRQAAENAKNDAGGAHIVDV
jgi:hypothetical protein